ncbi:MAG: hypothetical protein AB2988_06140, partial [Candidatus Symbiodolus clandestinus]
GVVMSDKDFPKEEELLMVNPQAQPLSSKRKISKPNNICQQQYLKTRSVRIYLYALKNRVQINNEKILFKDVLDAISDVKNLKILREKIEMQINNTQSDIPGVNE